MIEVLAQTTKTIHDDLGAVDPMQFNADMNLTFGATKVTCRWHNFAELPANLDVCFTFTQIKNKINKNHQSIENTLFYNYANF